MDKNILSYGFIKMIGAGICIMLSCICVSKITPAQTGNGKIYLAGVGPGDPQLATIRAMRVIEKANVVFCHKSVKERFSSYLQQKEVLMPEEGTHVWHGYGKSGKNLEGGELKMWKAAEKARKKIIDKTRQAFQNGKTVAFLSDGDPFFYGPWGWTMEEFKDLKPEAVPGLSSFNAANATLEKAPTSGGQTKSVIITMPDLPYMDKRESIENLAAHQATMVIFMPTVRGHTLEGHVKDLSAHYPPDTPIALVCYAGYEDREEVITGTLSNIQEKVEGQDETFLHLIYVGDFLTNYNRATR